MAVNLKLDHQFEKCSNMESFEELFEISKKLNDAHVSGDAQEISQPLDALKKSAEEINRSFCGSWLGYHSRVYYDGLVPAPPGAHFSQEWGLKDMGMTSLGSRGNWREYDYDEVKSVIYADAKNPIFNQRTRRPKKPGSFSITQSQKSFPFYK